MLRFYRKFILDRFIYETNKPYVDMVHPSKNQKGKRN